MPRDLAAAPLSQLADDYHARPAIGIPRERTAARHFVAGRGDTGKRCGIRLWPRSAETVPLERLHPRDSLLSPDLRLLLDDHPRSQLLWRGRCSVPTRIFGRWLFGNDRPPVLCRRAGGDREDASEEGSAENRSKHGSARLVRRHSVRTRQLPAVADSWRCLGDLWLGSACRRAKRSFHPAGVTTRNTSGKPCRLRNLFGHAARRLDAPRLPPVAASNGGATVR